MADRPDGSQSNWGVLSAVALLLTMSGACSDLGPDLGGGFLGFGGPYGDYDPVWSPNGLDIAYSGLRTDGGIGYAVHVTDMTGNVLQLTDVQGESPSWSPDGSRIAFGPEGLQVVDRVTGAVTELLSDSTVTDVAWSPDGQTIAFTAQATGLVESHIYALDVPTSAITRLTQPGTSYRHPSWSPDGSQLVFSSPDAIGFDQIRRMEADGSGVVTLTDHPSAAWEPSWSPCGTSIAFSAFTFQLRFAIHVMDSDGSNITALTDALAGDQQPSWSPDCSKIVFSSDRDNSDEIPVYSLWIMNVDGSGLRKLTRR